MILIDVPPDFRTHANYIEHFNRLSKGLSVKYNRGIGKANVSESLIMYKKIQLAELTYKSIVGESDEILKNLEYSQVCVSWIAVKSYYLLFNLLLVFEYLVSLDESAFNFSHKKVLNKFKDRIKNKDISFTKPNLMGNYSCFSIQNASVRSGANLASINYSDGDRFVLILKKIVKYKMDRFKVENKIKDFRSRACQIKRDEYLAKEAVNIIEFFYWYRIKANYKDLEFLNHSINSDEFAKYFSDFFELTVTFRRCLGLMINNMSQDRFGKDIIPNI
ncbi:hypothetical protein ACFL08_05430 [Patescibacteria group bacterium]